MNGGSKMRENKKILKSIITIHEDKGCCYHYEWLEEMLIPKVIGIITKFLHTTYSVLKTLPPGHRYRGDVEFL